MRIKRIELENFRIHGGSVVDIGDASLVVVRGENFSGKTTLRQALELCFTPTTDALDASGRGYQRKIKRGASKAVITTQVDTKHYAIERVVTLYGNSSRTQKTVCLTDPSLDPGPFDKKLESLRGPLAVVLNTDAFLRMDEREQKNLLAALVLPKRHSFDPEIVAAVEGALGHTAVNFNGEPFAAIQSAYKQLYDEREAVNRQVRDFVIPEALERPAGHAGNSKQLESALELARATRRRRSEERDLAVTEANKHEVARGRAQGLIEALEKAISELESQAEAAKAKLVPEDRLAGIKRYAEGKPQWETATAAKRQVEELIDNHLRQLARLEEIPDAGTKCPTCDQVVDGEKLERLAASLNQDLLDLKQRNEVIFVQLGAYSDVPKALEMLAAHGEALAKLSEIEAKLAEKRKQIEQTRPPEQTPFDFAPYDQSLAEMDAEVERMSAQLRPVIAAEERQKEITAKRKQLSELEAKAAELHRLVAYFDKGGIKAKLLSEYIGGFEHKVNEVLSAWDYKASLSMEPYSFDVTNARGDLIPVRELSGAERTIFSLAFQCAVSRTAGIGLVVIDEVATLLPELRPVLNRRLWKMIEDGYLEQVILLVADTSEQIKNVPGTAFFMVKDGTVRKLGGLNGRAD